MATSGTTTWNLDVAGIIETAARRARNIDLGSLSGQDARNARNCLNMVLTDITNLGYSLSKLEFKTLELTQGTTSYTLPVDVQDIFDVVYAKDNGVSANPRWTETPLTRIDLAAYNRINNKTEESYLSQYALHRGLSTVTMYLYPTSQNSDDELRYWALTRTEDASALNQDIDLPYRYTNSLIAGVAYYMGLETPNIPEEKLARLEKTYSSALEVAFGEDRDRSSMYITPSRRRY